MKFIHLSDLHIGKRLNGYSLIEDQRYILDQILSIIKKEAPDAVLIAGDVYDRGEPSVEAVTLLDDFLVQLSKAVKDVFIISGNHDSAERLSFANRLIELSGIHISSAYNGDIKPYIVKNETEEVNVYMLPFVKPINVRKYFPDEKIESYTDAVNVCIKKMDVDETKENIILVHQFVTGAKQSESEEQSVGGLDNVDSFVFKQFDYVALGHLHKPQDVESNKIRYCGTPLKYSFSEAEDDKSVTVIETNNSKEFSFSYIPLKPLHDMRELKGNYDTLMSKEYYDGKSYTTDYVKITLTDENEVLNAFGKLKTVYTNLMDLRYDNKKTRFEAKNVEIENVEEKKPIEIFNELYVKQNGDNMDDEQKEVVQKLIDAIWGGTSK